jgi:hypothetical protein
MNRASNRFAAGAHEEFLELGALWTSGELTEGDRRRLEGHLAVCYECREAKRQFETVVDETIPEIAAKRFEEEEFEMEPQWSPERAEAELFARLAREENTRADESLRSQPNPFMRAFNLSTAATWRNVWMLFAAGIILAVALCICAYQSGVGRGTRIAIHTRAGEPQETAIAQKLNDTERESGIAHAEIKERDGVIAALRWNIRQQSAELNALKVMQRQLASDLRRKDLSEQDLVRERNEFAERTEAAQARVETLQGKLDSIQRAASQDGAHRIDLQAKVDELSQLLKDRNAASAQQDELLAHDRDIRELIGARDLHIAEVYDVARTGQTQKPYGRVFFTKGKSLIFYAYDLDQAQAKNANIFQAWGRRGPDRQQALNLGIFYEDDVSKRRWILKFDDPKMLAQIDAVFVTVEQRAGNHEPSGKPLLFAYLSGSPNHP